MELDTGDNPELTETEKIFAGISNSNKYKLERFYLGSKQLAMKGAKEFKINALGFFGENTLKSLEEMASLLYKTGIVDSVEKGKEIAPTLDGKEISYRGFFSLKTLKFKEVPSLEEGKKAYKIWVC